MKKIPLLPSYNLTDVWKQAEKGENIHLSDLPCLSLQTFVLTQLMRSLKKPLPAVLWLVKNEKDEQRALLLLSYWQQQWKHPFLITAQSAGAMQWLTPLFNGLPFVLIARADGSSAPFPRRTAAEKNKYTIYPRQTASPFTLKKIIASSGFEENIRADQPHTYAVRGSIIDLWPPGFPFPIKIEIQENTIVNMSCFDRRGKKVGTPISSLVLPSLGGEKGELCLFSEWLSYFGLVVSSEEKMPTFNQPRPSAPPPILFFHPFAHPQSISFKGEILTAPLSLSQLKKQATQYAPEILLYSGVSNKLLSKMTGEKYALPPFLYAESWYSGKLRTLFLTHAAEKELLAKRHSRQRLLFLQKLHIGDYLVHQDHGIGRFAGITTQSVDHIPKEYVVIQYAEGDRLYLPPYHTDKVSTYIGGARPRLHRLSETVWPKKLKKIQRETLLIAHELVQLYAKRQIAPLSPLYRRPEEQRLENTFPYEMTSDQKDAWKDIEEDLARGMPMDRLICGDVAFGKTELAIRTAFRVIQNGFQVALLAPTTILVQQHFDRFSERLKPLGVRLALLSRWQEKNRQQHTVQELAQGDIDLIIGTHRLLSADVRLPRLKLLIIDEEQKFGVQDKEKLREKKPHVHTLTLSATPIPRTLNFSLSGIRDISLVQTPPPGRLPIITRISPFDQHEVKKALEYEISRGGQSYYLARHIHEMPALLHMLKKLLPRARIAIAHGRIRPKELAATMEKFDQGAIDILLCSTIIENGLDLENANTLIVHNAAYFGLSQLHQLRGRIGRGKRQGYAYLFFHRHTLKGKAEKRLRVLQSAHELGSGFDIALHDLELRGAGSFLGHEQHGNISAVGLALYSQLMEQAVARMKRPYDKPAPILDVAIDLPVDARIPEKTIPHESRRLNIYQKLSLAPTEKELLKEARKLIPHPFPQEVNALLKTLTLKLICQKAGIYAVDSAVLCTDPFEAKITMRLSPSFREDRIKKLSAQNTHWLRAGNQLKIKTSGLGDHWLDKLVENTRVLT